MMKIHSIVNTVVTLVLILAFVTAFSVYGLAEPTVLNVKPGDTLFLGEYEQNNKAEDGAEAIEWTVLQVNDSKALLLSTKVLDCQPYDADKKDTTWATSSLRKWLNNAFYEEAFSADEAALIEVTDVSNGKGEQPVKDKWEGKAGKDTKDNIWVLSYNEVKKYLNSPKVVGTEYANSKGAKAGIFGSDASWYTRSVGKKQNQATYITDSFDPQSTGVGSKMGIRPAMWISTTGDWAAFPYQRFQDAENLAKKAQFVEAYQIMDELGTYNGSAVASAQYRYDYAKEAMNHGEYADAVERFSAYWAYAAENGIQPVDEYNTTMPECYNHLALENLKDNNHSAAVELYKTLGEYASQKAVGYWFDYATAVMENGDYKTAISLYKACAEYAAEHKNKLSSDYDNNLAECYNKLAMQNLQSGDHDAAIGLYKELGEYNSEKAAGYWFDYASSVMSTGNYTEAIPLYEKYYDYVKEQSLKPAADYNVDLPECYYQLALQSMNNGEYKEAVSRFSELGQYKDVMEQLRVCFDKLHIPYRWMTQNNGSVVNAGSNGYSESKPIAGDDPHFGWSLGRFMISGYTEVDESKADPVFIKTPGDNLVLWFDLEQNIDALKENPDLTIASDTDGFDQALGFPKTNMGRGALLMKHTDFRNSDSEPIPYLDYLSATKTGVANTRVEIKEEGTYEVALDYEIHDGNLMHVFNNTYNYRIPFKFSVKNGSAMFYIFDLGTGAELEDGTRTSEGFRIDLANSHSLKIDVVRYALNQNGNGLDIRSNAPASDGDQFDRTGYYEITIENTETHEKMTKCIFVGSKGDLADFKDADSSLSKFVN